MTGSDKLEPDHMAGKSASPHSPPTVQLTLISLKLFFHQKILIDCCKYGALQTKHTE